MRRTAAVAIKFTLLVENYRRPDVFRRPDIQEMNQT
jgi:hypothetical protein